MKTMDITSVFILFLSVETIISTSSDNDININNNDNDNISTVTTLINNSSSERTPKMSVAQFRHVVTPLKPNNPVYNPHLNFPPLPSAKSDRINTHKHFENIHGYSNHAVNPPVFHYADSSYSPQYFGNNIKLPYVQPKKNFGNFYDASGFNIVSENPMSTLLNNNKKSAPNMAYPKFISPSLNNYFGIGDITNNNNNNNNPIQQKIEPNLAYYQQLNIRPKSGNNQADQYGRTYPDMKSHPAPSTFSPGLISPGGFKPIISPQFQSNPQVTERIRVFDTEPKTIYSTSFDNPGTLASAVRDFHAYPATPNAPGHGYQNYKSKTVGNYQPLAAQPQLLFHSTNTPSAYHSKPYERIRTDVEVIKKPKPHVSNDDDNDNDDNSEESFETGFKKHHHHHHNHNPFAEESEENHSSSSSTNNKANNHEKFNSPFFSSYEKSFGRYSAKTKAKQPSAQSSKIIEKPERYGGTSSKLVRKQPKNQVYENPDESLSHESHEYHDESENHYRKSPKNKKNNDEEENESYGSDERLPHHDSYRHDFKDEFLDGYKQAIPTNEYEHIKEVPEVEKEYKGKIVSVQIKNTPKSVSESHHVNDKNQPNYFYAPSRKYEEDAENEEVSTTEGFTSETNFGVKIKKPKSQSRQSNRVSDASPKLIDDTVKKTNHSVRRSSKKKELF